MGVTIPVEKSESGLLTEFFNPQALYTVANHKLEEALMRAREQGRISGFRREDLPSQSLLLKESQAERRLYIINRGQDQETDLVYLQIVRLPGEGIKLMTIHFDMDYATPPNMVLSPDMKPSDYLSALLDEINLSDIETIKALKGDPFEAFMEELEGMIGRRSTEDHDRDHDRDNDNVVFFPG